MLETSRVWRVIWALVDLDRYLGWDVVDLKEDLERTPGVSVNLALKEGCPAAGVFPCHRGGRGACLNATKLSSLKIFWRPSAASGNVPEGAQRKTSSGGDCPLHTQRTSVLNRKKLFFAKDQAERGRPRPSCQFTITVLPYRGGASGGCELARRSHGLRELLREAAAAGMEMGSARRRAGELR